MRFQDYYETLGVGRKATPEEIKRAYRGLVRKFHPDVSDRDDAEERFKELQEAYDVLKDPEKRAAYDQFGEHWEHAREATPPPGYRGDEFARDGMGSARQFSDLFENMFGGAAAGRGQRGYSTFEMSGQDRHAKLMISLAESFHGATREISLPVHTTDAMGRTSVQNRTLRVTIPKGIKAGQRIRLAEQGGAGFGGAPAGDLFLEVAFAPDPKFRADGRDLLIDVPITPWEAALGAVITVPTLGRKVDVKVPAGSQSAKRLRLKGRGLPGQPAGDQYVVLSIVVPPTDSPQTRKLFEQMRDTITFDPRADL